MLKIYDQNHKQVGMLTRYKDLKVESALDSADKKLSFTVLDADEIRLKNEYYVRTRTDEFVVKKISHKSWSNMTVTCLLNLEELQGNPFSSFAVTDKSLYDAAELALQGTGWKIGSCDVEKIRSAGMVDCTTLEVIDNLCTAFMCDHDYDTLTKTVNFYRKMGSNKGAYFIDGLNLKKITKESDSCDYYTRIIPIGADGITIESVNDGKNYLENYQYSNKVLTYIWKDETYTDSQALMEDAQLKLQEMSMPAETYSCDIVDLARQRKDYEQLAYALGDEVRLINRETRTLTRRRITKIIEYPENPEKNSCEFSNVTLTFTEMQEKLKKASDIINYVITSDGKITGTISVSNILNFETGITSSTTIKKFDEDITSLQKTVSELEENIGTIGDLTQTYAMLSKANVPEGWIGTDQLAYGAVTAEKLDLTDVIDAIFSNVIIAPEFVDAYLQRPVITEAVIDAEELKVNGTDIVQLLEELADVKQNEQRLTELEEKMTEVIAALANVIADEPEEGRAE